MIYARATLIAMAIAVMLTPAPAMAADPLDAPLDALVAAYPDALAGHTADTLLWRDGTRMPLGVATGDIDHATLADQLAKPYGAGPIEPPSGDPGRMRDRAFFDHLYGDCTRGEVAPHLVTVDWFGQSLLVTSRNGVAAALAAVAADVATLPPAVRRAASPSAGTYLCRDVRGEHAPSMHAYGAAIDVNVALSDYWRWGGGAWRNRIPAELVAAFERHGFIWGGRWRHFDTMHFEYRPELQRAAWLSWSRPGAP